MEMCAGIFDCPAMWERLLPPDTRRLRHPKELERNWPLLTLTPAGCRALEKRRLNCRILLAPGDCGPQTLAGVKAEVVVSYGLSPRDSLTLSSLTEPLLCVQRMLPRPDGGFIDPQELPLPPLPGTAEELLPLLGLRLLQIPGERWCDLG